MRTSPWIRMNTAPFLAALLTLAGCAKDDKITVLNCFDDYTAAVLQEDGQAALGFVSESSIEYYGTILDKALNAPRGAVEAMSVLDRIAVLQIRLVIPPKALRRMTAETLFVRAVEKGMVGRETASGSSLGAVLVFGDLATGVAVVGGERTPLKWVFFREGDKWKLDLTSIMPAANQSMAFAIQKSGKTENEFITAVLESVTGVELTDSVWEPPAG